MRKSVQALAVIGLCAMGGAGQALAQATPSYPRVIEMGENKTLDYGPMGQRSVVFGGGRVVVTMMDGANVTLMHLDSMFMQSAREGLIPLTIGSGESTETVWVPSDMLEAIRRARALGTGR